MHASVQLGLALVAAAFAGAVLAQTPKNKSMFRSSTGDEASTSQPAAPLSTPIPIPYPNTYGSLKPAVPPAPVVTLPRAVEPPPLAAPSSRGKFDSIPIKQ